MDLRAVFESDSYTRHIFRLKPPQSTAASTALFDGTVRRYCNQMFKSDIGAYHTYESDVGRLVMAG